MQYAPDTKDKNYTLYERKEYGNQLLTWPCFSDYISSGFEGRVVIRNKIPGDKRCAYNLTREDAVKLMCEWDPVGAEAHIFKMNESAPDDLLVIQGEVTLETGFMEVRYSTLKKPMRIALAEGQKVVRGLAARVLLRHYLDDLDYETLNEMLDTYRLLESFRDLPVENPYTLDDPKTRVTVEFSVWSRPVGHLNRRMVVWEIRNY